MESIKDKVKDLAKQKNVKMEEIAENLKLTSQGMYKAFRDKTVKLKQLEQIAQFLSINVQDLLPSKMDNLNIAGERVTNYQTRVDGNNFFSGQEPDYIRLKTENEQLKVIIEKQDKEIEFLRDQLTKRG